MAIQTLYASEFVAVMLRCVFGHKWTDIPNRTPTLHHVKQMNKEANVYISPDLPESAGITSANLLAFGILWIIQFPFAFIHPSKMTLVFKIKSVIAPIGLIATMIWALVRPYQVQDQELH
jgi:nucleobase:cation symporter-1, NCS1 family